MTNSMLPPINTSKIFTRPGELIDAAKYKKNGITSIRINAADLSNVECFWKNAFIAELAFK